jgi:hypothetical protein
VKAPVQFAPMTSHTEERHLVTKPAAQRDKRRQEA